MKRLLIYVGLSLFFQTAAYSQIESICKLIPNDTSLSKQILQTDSFQYSGTHHFYDDGHQAVLESFLLFDGTLFDRNCEMALIYSSAKRQIVGTTIRFYDFFEWGSILTFYQKVEDSISDHSAYRRMSRLHKFIHPFSEGDGQELQALFERKCRYITTWKLRRHSFAKRISLDVISNGAIQNGAMVRILFEY